MTRKRSHWTVESHLGTLPHKPIKGGRLIKATPLPECLACYRTVATPGQLCDVCAAEGPEDHGRGDAGPPHDPR